MAAPTESLIRSHDCPHNIIMERVHTTTVAPVLFSLADMGFGPAGSLTKIRVWKTLLRIKSSLFDGWTRLISCYKHED